MSFFLLWNSMSTQDDLFHNRRYLQSEEETLIPWSVVYTTLIVSLVVGLVLYVVFGCTRSQHSKQQRLDIYECRQALYGHRSGPPFAGVDRIVLGWARVALQTSNDETLRCVGLDMYMFLRFLRLSFRCSFVGAVLGCAVLVPIYATGDEEGLSSEQFNVITLANIPQGSAKLWASAACWLLFVLFTIHELWTEYKDSYAPRRYDFLARGDVVDTDPEYRYACVVENIPTPLRTNRRLYEFLNRLFPNSIHQVHVCMNTVKLDGLIQKRLGYIVKLEAVVAKRKRKPDAAPMPMVKPDGGGCCCGNTNKKVEAIPYYQAEIAKLNEEIDMERNHLFFEASSGDSSTTHGSTTKKNESNGVDDNNGFEVVMDNTVDTSVAAAATATTPNKKNDSTKNNTSNGISIQEATNKPSELMSSTAFVTFTSLKAKQTAIQCNIGGKVDYLDVSPAPEPKGVVWNNVTANAKQQQQSEFLSSLFWLTGIIFWAVPVLFVTGLANLNSMLKTFNIAPMNEETFYYGLLAGILPVAFLQALMFAVYFGLIATATYVIRKKSLPEIDAYTFFWFMLYQFANLWLILIGGSAFNQLDAMIEDPSSIVNLMAAAIPGASTFFLNMIILNSFAIAALQLSNLVPLLVKWALSKVTPEECKTQRMLDDDKKAMPLPWGQTLPPIVFILLVGFVYMAIVPMLEAFVAVYFGIYYVVWKHNCLHVYANESEGGGIIWEKLFVFIMACLYIGEVVVIAYMGIKEGTGPAIFAIVPLVLTILMHMKLGREVIGPLQNLSMEVAADVDIKDGELTPMTLDRLSYQEAVEKQLYGQPSLKLSKDERGPMPYRRRDDASSEDVETGVPTTTTAAMEEVNDKEEELVGAVLNGM